MTKASGTHLKKRQSFTSKAAFNRTHMHVLIINPRGYFHKVGVRGRRSRPRISFSGAAPRLRRGAAPENKSHRTYAVALFGIRTLCFSPAPFSSAQDGLRHALRQAQECLRKFGSTVEMIIFMCIFRATCGKMHIKRKSSTALPPAVSVSNRRLSRPTA